jgi:hypothetical protein
LLDIPAFCRVGLFAGAERQRFDELNRNAAHESIYVINPADSAAAGETCHIEAVSGAESRDAEASGQFLALIRTVFVGLAGKRRRSAGNINHLTL